MLNYMIQSVLFPKSFSFLEIQKFLNTHNLHPIKPIHETAKFKRVRISEPNYKNYYTRKLPNGVDLFYGY